MNSDMRVETTQRVQSALGRSGVGFRERYGVLESEGVTSVMEMGHILGCIRTAVGEERLNDSTIDISAGLVLKLVSLSLMRVLSGLVLIEVRLEDDEFRIRRGGKTSYHHVPPVDLTPVQGEVYRVLRTDRVSITRAAELARLLEHSGGGT